MCCFCVYTSGQVPSRAEYNFLDRVRWLDMYGVVLYPVKVNCRYFTRSKSDSVSCWFLKCILVSRATSRLWLAPHCRILADMQPDMWAARHICPEVGCACRHKARQRGTDQSRRSVMTSRSIISLQCHVMCPCSHVFNIIMLIDIGWY